MCLESTASPRYLVTPRNPKATRLEAPCFCSRYPMTLCFSTNFRVVDPVVMSSDAQNRCLASHGGAHDFRGSMLGSGEQAM